MTQALVWAAFAAGLLLAFRRWPPAVAAAVGLVAGWLLLPAGPFPEGSGEARFAYWITGAAVPSPMWLTKAAGVPVLVLMAAVVMDRDSWRGVLRWRLRADAAHASGPRWLLADAWVLAWCLWPLVGLWTFWPRSGLEADPPPWWSCAYLAAVWGVPWLLGRVYFAQLSDRRLLAQVLVWSVLACLPFALVEGIGGVSLHSLVYELHPFREDGLDRTVGHRPVGFFEHGNQYGIWVSLCAVLAPLLVLTRRNDDRLGWVVVGLVVAVALAAQSAGGLLLGGACWALLALRHGLRWRAMVAWVGAAAALVGAVYLSGALPIHHWVRNTEAGRQALQAARAVGLGSFAWRVSQDQKVLPLVKAQPVAGQQRWDWWRQKDTRPWGLGMLTAGQFGLVGAALWVTLLLWPVVRIFRYAPYTDPRLPRTLDTLLAMVVVAAVLDGMVNSFFFYPAILIAGALAAHSAAIGRPATAAP